MPRLGIEIKNIGYNRYGRMFITLVGIPRLSTYIEGLFFKKTLRILEKPSRVLDSGCSIGLYSFFLSKKLSNTAIDAIDIDKNSIKKARKISLGLGHKKNRINFFVEDARKYKRKNSYDFIFSIDVLYLFSKSGASSFIMNSYNSLKKRGIFFIHTPSEFYADTILPKGWYEDSFLNLKKEIQKPLKKQEIEKIMKRAGFEIITSIYTLKNIFKFCWEIELILKEKKFGKLLLTILPLLKFLCKIDYYLSFLTKSKGTGVLIIARKG